MKKTIIMRAAALILTVMICVGLVPSEAWATESLESPPLTQEQIPEPDEAAQDELQEELVQQGPQESPDPQTEDSSPALTPEAEMPTPEETEERSLTEDAEAGEITEDLPSDPPQEPDGELASAPEENNVPAIETETEEEFKSEQDLTASLVRPGSRAGLSEGTMDDVENSITLFFLNNSPSRLNTAGNALADPFKKDGPEAVFNSDMTSVSILGDLGGMFATTLDYYAFKLEGDFTIGGDYAPGELRIVINQPIQDLDYDWFNQYGVPEEIEDTYSPLQFNIGPGDTYWDMKATRESITLTNKVAMPKGATGHFQLAQSIYTYDLFTADFDVQFNARMLSGGKLLTQSNPLSIQFTRYPTTFPATKGILAKSYNEFPENMTDEEEDQARNSDWVTFDLQLNTDTLSVMDCNSISPKTLRYWLRIPEGAELLDPDGLWTYDAGTGMYYHTRDCKYLLYQTHFHYSRNFGNTAAPMPFDDGYLIDSVSVRYPKDIDFDSIDGGKKITVSLWGDYLYQNENVDRYYDYLVSKGLGQVDSDGLHKLVEKSYTGKVNTFSFIREYGTWTPLNNNPHQPYGVSLPNKEFYSEEDSYDPSNTWSRSIYSTVKDIKLAKEDMTADKGVPITVWPGVYLADYTDIAKDIVIVQDMLYYQTQSRGLVRAASTKREEGRPEYTWNSVVISSEGLNALDLKEHTLDDANSAMYYLDHDFPYEILVHTADMAEGEYQAVSGGEGVINGSKLTTTTHPLPANTTAVAVVFTNVPGNNFFQTYKFNLLYGMRPVITINGTLKPYASAIDDIYPTQQAPDREGQVYYSSFAETFRTGTSERITHARPGYYGGDGQIRQSLIDHDLSTPTTLHGSSVAINASGDYRGRENSYIHVGGVPIHPLISITRDKDRPVSLTEQGGRKGYLDNSSLYLTWMENAPDSVGGFQICDLLPKGYQDLSGEEYTIAFDALYNVSLGAATHSVKDGKSVSGYYNQENPTELKLADGTAMGLAQAEQYLKEHCVRTETPDYQGSGRTLVTYTFQFEPGKELVPSEKNDRSTGGYLEFRIARDLFIPLDLHAANTAADRYEMATLRLTQADGIQSFYPAKTGWHYRVDEAENISGVGYRYIDKLAGQMAADGSGNPVFSADMRMLTANVVLSASLQHIRKYVSTDLNPQFVKENEASLGSIYTYRLALNTSAKNPVGNLVFYDVLEGEEGAQWKGTFAGVDTSDLTRLGCAPEVYYATADPGEITIDAPGQTVWTTRQPSDLASVVAIAVDCTAAADGGDFMVQENSTAFVEVRMTAPEQATLGTVTKNHFYTTMDAISEFGEHFPADTVSDTVTVTLNEPGSDVVLFKHDSLTGKPLAGAQFLLSGTSDAGVEIRKMAVSGKDGVVKFLKVPAGTYQVAETKAPEGYYPSRQTITAKVEKQTDPDTGKLHFLVTFDCDESGRVSELAVGNEPRDESKQIAFTFRKTDVAGMPLPGAIFRLTQLDGSGKMVSQDNGDGTYSFDGLGVGRYLLNESKAPEGYERTEHYWILTVTDPSREAELTVTVTDEDGITIRKLTVVDGTDVSGTAVLIKRDDTGELLPGAVFKLVDTEGNTVARNLVTNDAGMIHVSGLKPEGSSLGSTYYFVETQAPFGYQLDPTPIMVYITARGGVTTVYMENDPSVGALSITKTVKGPGADWNHRFLFDITMTDPEGKPVSGLFSDPSNPSASVVCVEDGKGQVELKHGETVVLGGIPAGVDYTVTEVPDPDYQLTAAAGASGTIRQDETSAASFVNTALPTEVWVDIYWDDLDDIDGVRPEDVQITLYRIGADGNPIRVDSQKVTPDGEGKWHVDFTDLPKYSDDGSLIRYTVTQNDQNGETTPPDQYTVTSGGTQTDGFTFTNRYRPVTEVKVDVYWDDLDDVDHVRPEEVRITLYRIDPDGTAVKLEERTVGADVNGNWHVDFTGLPKYEQDGTLIRYAVTQNDRNGETTAPEAYTVRSGGSQEKGFVFVNRHRPENNPKPEPTPPNKRGEPQSPKTGDSAHFGWYAGSMLLSAAGAMILLARGKRTGRRKTY